MKKTCFIICTIASSFIYAQFTVSIDSPANFDAKEAYLYTLNGSKDILKDKATKKGNTWTFKMPENYFGMMKVYFPDTNDALNFISENKEVKIKIEVKNNKITDIYYLDEVNAVMEKMQDSQKKNEVIFPALIQIKEYYKDNSPFGSAIKSEIQRLGEKLTIDPAKNPFISYYNTNYNKFVAPASTDKKATQDEMIDYLSKTNNYLESSSLVRPILVSFLNSGSNTNVKASVDKLLTVLNVETPRGQTILSELIDIFDVYDMTDLKKTYLTEAQNLKCTINERLASTIEVNKNVELGSKFPNYTFKNVINSTAKSLYDVKADKKIVIFWSSTCSHCEAELPKLLEKYNTMKSKNIQIIGLSLDTVNSDYQNKVKNYPWINDSEIKGWYSSYVNTYNIHATPTYFILDSNNVIIEKPDHVPDVLSALKLN